MSGARHLPEFVRSRHADSERVLPALLRIWFDQIPGKHRLFFDTLTDGGLREARGFANNYFDGSKSGYGLEASDLAVVICLRHSATPFAFTDPFWAKYGPVLAESLKLADTEDDDEPAPRAARELINCAACTSPSATWPAIALPA